MSLRQSGTSLDVLLAALDAFEDGRAQRAVAGALAREGQQLVHRGFEESRAPSGAKWAPIKRPRGRAPLRKTGTLEGAALVYTFSADGFVFGAVDRLTAYGHYHQSEEPRTRLPRRPFFPNSDGQLPTGWSIVLAEGADEALAKLLPR
ncbi:MAG: hypothetical protein EPO40_19555 [Myxococcaceae bacterium]|nr:MAG: hypothetical protein EPO40_19555 [Myxococcaceae bacterium]